MIKNAARKETKTGREKRRRERVTELLSAATDFWFRCANSFHLMRIGEALHQSWKERQHSSIEGGRDDKVVRALES